MRHLKSKTDTSETSKAAQLISRSDSIEPVPTLKVAERFAKYATNNFVYSTKLVRNAILLHNEYLRDDFYSLQFQVPTKPADTGTYSGKEYALKIIDITSKENKDILFAQLPADPEGFLFFDSLTQRVFNPRKRLPWIAQIDDLVGNTFRFDLIDGTQVLESKYIYLDYFSYENYIIVRN